MPILTVAQYRELTGVTADPPSDADIQLALLRYEGIIEGYCMRSFSLQERTERYLVDGDPLVLNHRPVNAITTLVVDGQAKTVSDYNMLLRAGLLWHDGAFTGLTADVTYSAGYADAPMDLKVVLANLTKGYLDGVFGGTSELSRVKSETVYGVSKTDYDVSASAITQYAELGPFTTVLDKYIEVAFA